MNRFDYGWKERDAHTNVPNDKKVEYRIDVIFYLCRYPKQKQ